MFGCSLGMREEGSENTEDHEMIEDETYALLPESVHVEIVDENNNLLLRTHEWGHIVVTNLHRKSIQPLVRFNMGDIGRLVTLPGHEQALQVKGRASTAMSFRLSAWHDYLHWKDIEDEVLAPLTAIASAERALCLAQVIFTTSIAASSQLKVEVGSSDQGHEDLATLAVFTTLPPSFALDEAINKCSLGLASVFTRVGRGLHVNTQVHLLKEMSELCRSPRSQKLLLWVDHRHE